MQQVEIELDARSLVNQVDDFLCSAPFPVPSVALGSGFGWAFLLINVERITNSGATVVVDGFADITQPGPVLPPVFCSGPPVPDVPLLSVWPRFVRFAPPAGGGSYQLNLYTHAYASAIGIASADAEAYLELKHTTIRFRR